MGSFSLGTMLETREEYRAATTTTNLSKAGTMQWPPDDRIFGHDTLTDALGVEVHSVPIGNGKFPIAGDRRRTGSGR